MNKILGNGVDIVKVSRFKNKEATIKRFLSPSEYKEYKSLKTSQAQLEFAASRWALKEAIIKACPHPIETFNIKIEKKREKLSFVHSKYNFYISLSHEKEYTVGYAICLEK